MEYAVRGAGERVKAVIGQSPQSGHLFVFGSPSRGAGIV